MLGSFSVSAMKKTGAPGRVGEGLKMIAIDHFSEKFQRNMRVPLHIVEARRDKLAQLIETHRYLPLRELCERLGVSEATARRDLAELAKRNVVKRTHGGALAEYNERFPSFNERRSLGGAGKQKVAKAAARFIEPGGTYFLDSGTTIFAMAEFLRDAPVTPATIVTSNLPVGELLAGVEGLSVYLTAGQILGRQSVLLGETALHSLEFWNFDIAFLSAEAANAEGFGIPKRRLSRCSAWRWSARNGFCFASTTPKSELRRPNRWLVGIGWIFCSRMPKPIASAEPESSLDFPVSSTAMPLHHCLRGWLAIPPNCRFTSSKTS